MLREYCKACTHNKDCFDFGNCIRQHVAERIGPRYDGVAELSEVADLVGWDPSLETPVLLFNPNEDYNEDED